MIHKQCQRTQKVRFNHPPVSFCFVFSSTLFLFFFIYERSKLNLLDRLIDLHNIVSFQFGVCMCVYLFLECNLMVKCKRWKNLMMVCVNESFFVVES